MLALWINIVNRFIVAITCTLKSSAARLMLSYHACNYRGPYLFHKGPIVKSAHLAWLIFNVECDCSTKWLNTHGSYCIMESQLRTLLMLAFWKVKLFNSKSKYVLKTPRFPIETHFIRGGRVVHFPDWSLCVPLSVEVCWGRNSGAPPPPSLSVCLCGWNLWCLWEAESLLKSSLLWRAE